MEKNGEQTKKMEGEDKNNNKGGKVEEGLPMESSPYTQYKDLEDYKRQGYGTQGHQQPKPGGGGGSTDAPTLSGDGRRP
ncbi:hypothetical protein ACSBR2_009856 [Camellia fascicularis]|uniref:Uncharacterized protein n=1 Tax=Camellia sinensis TaxID=4442 RepID=A0A7J7I899_CAMSI|nr:hypothetical protein HYC85_002411 [Camellia sinensis]